MPLLTDRDIIRGWFRKRVFLSGLLAQDVIPKMWVNYCRGIAKRTGLSLETVMKSKPAQEYLKKLREVVK